MRPYSPYPYGYRPPSSAEPYHQPPPSSALPPQSDPYHYPPPSRHLLPSNSFPSPPPSFQPPARSNYFVPPAAAAPSNPPPPASSFYDPYYNPYPNPQPYAYPPPPRAPEPYYINSSPHGSSRYDRTSDSTPSAPPALSPSSSSSSLYPIDSLMESMRLSEPSAPGSPSGNSHHRMPAAALVSPSGSLHHHVPSTASIYGTPNHSFSHSHGGMQIVPFQKQPSDKASLKVLLLHGSLDIWVYDARNLPNMDMFSKTIGDLIGPHLSGSLTGKLDNLSSMTSDPYVSVVVAGASVARTFVIDNTENPVWTQRFVVPIAHHAAEIQFIVKDNDVVGSQLMGTVSIPAEWVFSGERVEGVYPVLAPNGKPCHPGAQLRLSVHYIPIERQHMYQKGVGAGPEFTGVLGTYFPLRKGGRVTLYQDAHVPDGCCPEPILEHGARYKHGRCWHDIAQAIAQARRMIYIVGWSVFHTVRLVRDSGYGNELTLGDLLKSKSQEGVRVLLLVWDDPTSRSILGFKMEGVMQTRDEETRRFFKHSSVQVLLCPRAAGKRHSWVKQQETGTIYTHHQKTVIVDADAGGNKRKIIAFVGGLDLCGGRYDTPWHPLFRTLHTLHKDDFHNPTFAGPDASGPREPWHDLHCRIDGPAAYDVLTNFEERWLKASKRHGIKKLKRSGDDALLKIERIPDIIKIHDSAYSNENDPETWHVQVFRSIDSNSAKGFPKDPRIAISKNLVCGKNVLIDTSIHTAYVNAIRSAQHFIYIENQYFLGSSYNWDTNKDLGANNLVPMEIALKIANKIKVNERFSAYIVVPMWPEGNPTGAPTQRILFWQNKTMQMMYETIHKALKEVGLEDVYDPQDYLNFFCLGNREVLDPYFPPPPPGPAVVANSPLALAKKNRRFMIYVHSKGMIVDDEYVILGSANINQRSLEGTRDTEIAMGAYQPNHTWARVNRGPRGQVHGYRMSLWAEHIGGLEECFMHPESLECTRRVRALGEQNWRQFAAEDITEMRAHLLKYPVQVDRRGKVKPIPGCETFPDVGGSICGTFLAIQENLTI